MSRFQKYDLGPQAVATWLVEYSRRTLRQTCSVFGCTRQPLPHNGFHVKEAKKMIADCRGLLDILEGHLASATQENIEPCGECDGTGLEHHGEIMIDEPCEACAGEGEAA